MGAERVDSGVVRFRPFGSPDEPFVSFERARQAGDFQVFENLPVKP